MMPIPPPCPSQIYTIPAGVPFATTLAAGIIERAVSPEALARATILVPSRRAAQALRAAFLEICGDTATLLPRIDPIGDVEEDAPDLLAFAADGIDLPPPMDPLQRQLWLSRLLRGFTLGGLAPTVPQTVRLAEALARLLDQLGNADSTPDMLRDLLPDRFSLHWQDILKLLTILIDRWPAILEERGEIDAAARRNRLVRLRCQIWQDTRPEHMIVVAGSTGTFAATRELIGCVAGLPDGHVVLPGLDLGASDHWSDIREAAGHPQHQLAALLDSLEVAPHEVALWQEGDHPQAAARRDLMRQTFLPAALTAQWRQLGRTNPDLGRDALNGMSVVECASRGEEAALIAVAMREVLEVPERTAALVTPDRQLAEAVIAALRRWNIDVDDSAGRSLAQCQVGGFLHLLVQLCAEDFAPMAMLGFLKHPLVGAGMPPSEFGVMVRALEREIFRGYRPAPGIDGILEALQKNTPLCHFVEHHIQIPLAGLLAAWQSAAPTLGSLAEALGATAERFAARRLREDGTIDEDDGAMHLWGHEDDGRAAASLLAALTEQGSDFEIDVESFPPVLSQMMDTRTVRSARLKHPRLAILGPVEARMQSADRIILGGFNEGNWPPRPEIDPWTNAEMRQAAGLQPHSWRTGLSAHDVWMASCSPEVIITRALRDGDAATTPSRWLQRLDAVMAALSISDALDRGNNWHHALQALSPVPPLAPVGRPKPMPPVDLRPRRFSATEIDDWIIDPYSLYAKRILGLRQLDEIDRPVDAALRGNLVHAALAEFLKTHPAGTLPENALDQLCAIGRRVFEPHLQLPNVRLFWWPGFEAIAAWFVETETRRRATVMTGHSEIDGSIEIDGPQGPAQFTARADRIDQLVDGGLVVLDYKTGSAPRAAEVAAGRRTQLLVESVIAAEGGFDDIPADNVVGMEYWKLSGRRGEAGSREDVRPPDWQAADTRANLERLVMQFDDPAMPYASRPDLSIDLPFARYDHLARVDEWRIAETGMALVDEGEGGVEISSDISDAAAAATGHATGIDAGVAADASRQQALASDPSTSVFVSANAGTGKTKLLTDRVLRLMLEGAPPDSILCVTYTRAAAAEMRNRISAKLAKWTVMTAEELLTDLAGMGIGVASQEVQQRARSLFAEILDNDDGPRVETVHSFCQSVLRRFPIEAGIVPHAELADDIEQARLKAQARDTIMRRADPAIQLAIASLAEQTSEGNAEDLLNSLMRDDPRLGEADILVRLDRHFAEERGIDPQLDVSAMMDDALASLDVEGLRATAAALEDSGKKNHVGRGAQITRWIGESEAGRQRGVDLLIDALFRDGAPRSQLSNKDIRDVFPAVDDVQKHAQSLLSPFIAARAQQRCRDLTKALYRHGQAFHLEYQRLKAQRGLLDYDDLIVLTNRMLARGEAAQWVAWKLDNGIQHMLLDEAQDTSPAQWQLLRRLGDEFFENASDSGLPRTMFIVGDFKQSIYSFQGADPQVMGSNRIDLKARATRVDSALRDVSLDVSFRSATPVLDLVNCAVPELAGITDPRMPDFQLHRSARLDAGGFIEVWPVIRDESEDIELPGFAPPDIQPPRDAAALSAATVARELAGWIGKRRLPSGRVMRAGDIMILLRKRGRYYRLLLAALQRAGVPVAGADRMKLAEQIEIQDLLALGDVVLLPEDDLQLAAVLKSPIFGLDEDELFTLAQGRGKQSLYARVMEQVGADSSVGRIADQLLRYRLLSEQQSVFAFFSSLLGETRQEFRRRLGAAVDESLDHFLALAQSYGVSGGVALGEFLALVRGSGGEVRRDMDNAAADEVRVMTIHGSKGLEAPVVVLPDMLRQTSRADQLVRDEDSGFVYWAPGEVRPDFVSAAREADRGRRDEEENRLLYVALTRARDGIVIGGWEAGRRRFLKDSPYEMLKSAVRSMEGAVEDANDGSLRLMMDGGGEGDGGAGRMPIAVPPDDVPRTNVEVDVPHWLFSMAPVEPRPTKPLRPSESDPAEGAIAAPGTRLTTVAVALSRGRFAHRLFEVLPQIPAVRREAAAHKMVASQRDLPADEARRLVDQVMQVMQLDSLASLFGPDSLAEVAISGVVGGSAVAGQIDRLFVDDEQVMIVDFKTGPRPSRPPESYVRQMALYAALMQQIHPQKAILTWLVWSESATVQEIDEASRQLALAALTDLQAE